MRTIIITLLLSLCLGCVRRTVKAPVLTARVCPKDSVRHVAQYNNKLIEICEDTQTHGLFAMGPTYNPYQNIDGDDDDEMADNGHKHPHSWWRFWDKHETDHN